MRNPDKHRGAHLAWLYCRLQFLIMPRAHLREMIILFNKAHEIRSAFQKELDFLEEQRDKAKSGTIFNPSHLEQLRQRSSQVALFRGVLQSSINQFATIIIAVTELTNLKKKAKTHDR